MTEHCMTCRHRETNSRCVTLERFVGDTEWCADWREGPNAPPVVAEGEPLEVDLGAPDGGMCGSCRSWLKVTTARGVTRVCTRRGSPRHGDPTLPSDGCGMWHMVESERSKVSEELLEIAGREALRRFDAGVFAKITEGADGAVKDDQAKPRHDLIAPELLDALGGVLRYGADKYAPRNWELGMEWGRVYAALQRHLWAWWGGQALDKETGFSHLHHAACCLMFLVTYEARGTGTDDRPRRDDGTD